MKKMEGVNKVAIVGTGMIATSLAVLTTSHGYDTIMFAMSDELIAQSKKVYNDFYAQFVEQKIITEDQVKICEKYLNYTLSYKDLADADIAFEAVVEKVEVKHQVYKSLEENCPNLKAICSVSSAIVPDKLAEGAGKNKSLILVTHPFNPPHMVPYFEMAKGTDTDPKAVEFAKSFLEALDRKPVVLKKPAPGFIGNRLQFALWREALNIVDSGIADPRDVDTCLMYSFCPRYTAMGIYENFDNGGLQLNESTCRTIFPTLSNITEPPKSITDRIARGETGIKAGKGFYEWKESDIEEFNKRVSAPYWKFVNWEFPNE